jgi:hypothetical protein
MDRNSFVVLPIPVMHVLEVPGSASTGAASHKLIKGMVHLRRLRNTFSGLVQHPYYAHSI